MNPRLQRNAGHNGVLSYTTPFGGSSINEARIGIQLFNQYTGPQPIPGLFQQLGLPVYPEAIGWPGIYWWDDAQPNISVIDRDNPKQAPNQNVTAADNYSWIRGKHEVNGLPGIQLQAGYEKRKTPEATIPLAASSRVCRIPAVPSMRCRRLPMQALE